MTLKSTIVIAPSGASAWQTNCHGNEHLWYFDPRTEHSEAPDIYAKLTQRAKTRIWTWDPYLLGNDDVDCYGDLQPSISVRILADLACSQEAHKGRAGAFYSEFMRRFHGRGVALSVRVIDRESCTGEIMQAWRFHDRYLIVDDEVFVVGASLLYFRRRMHPIYVARVGDPEAKKLVLRKFEAAWSDSKTAKAWCGTTNQFKIL